MNLFVLTAGLLYLGGAASYFFEGKHTLGFIYIGYAFTNFLLARL
jgi:hypothetical protein